MKKLVSFLLVAIMLFSLVGGIVSASADSSSSKKKSDGKEVSDIDYINALLTGEKFGDGELTGDGDLILHIEGRGQLKITIKTDTTKKAVKDAKINIYSVTDEKTSKGFKVATIKTNSKGVASILLPVGKYYFSLPTLPDGYKWDNKILSTKTQWKFFTIEEGKVAKFSLSCLTDEAKAKGKLQLTLRDENGNPVKGGKYYIVKSSWVGGIVDDYTKLTPHGATTNSKKITNWIVPAKKYIVKTITTNKNGVATASLPAGEYKVVRDFTLPVGYSWVKSSGGISATIGNPVKTFTISNNKTKKITDTCAIDKAIGKIQVVLKDENGNPVPKAKIYICKQSQGLSKNDGVLFYTGATTQASSASEGSFYPAFSYSKEAYKTLTTNSKGVASASLQVGNYYIPLTDESMPLGYTWGIVAVSDGGSLNSLSLTRSVSIKQGKTSKLVLTCKTDPRETSKVKLTLKYNYKNPVVGAKFYIYILDTSSSYAEKKAVKLMRTGSDGVATVDLPVGKYYITKSEDSLPSGYVWSSTSPTVYWKTFDIIAGKTSTLTASCHAKKDPVDDLPANQKGKVQFTLKDNKGRPVKGAKFTIRVNDFSSKSSSSNRTYTMTTNEKGVATRTLPLGTYCISQGDLPSGYEWAYLVNTLQWRVFVIEPKTTAKLAATCVALDTTETGKTGTFKLYVVDQYGDKVPDAVYKVFYHDVSVGKTGEAFTFNTAKNGVALMKNVPVGKYNLDEVNPTLPNGYHVVLAKRSHPFTIKANKTTTITLTVQNDNVKKGKGIFCFTLIEGGDKSKPVANATITICENPSTPMLGSVAAKVTTDKYGVAKVVLPVGNYYISQGAIVLPDGYEWKYWVNTLKWINFSIEEGKTVSRYVSCNKVEDTPVSNNDPAFLESIMAEFTVMCRTEDMSVERNALKGIGFTITDSKGNFVQDLVTDEHGMANTIDLMAGTYYVTCTSVPEGLKLLQPATLKYKLQPMARTRWAHFLFGIEGTGKVKITVSANKTEGKEASSSNETIPVEGAKINIYRDIFDASVGSKRWSVVQTIKTDKNGVAVSGNLPIGDYYISQFDLPAKFTWSKIVNTLQYKTFTIKKGKTTNLNVSCLLSGDDTGKTLADFKSVEVRIPVSWKASDGSKGGTRSIANTAAMGVKTDYIHYDGSEITLEGKKITSSKVTNVYGTFSIIPYKPETYVKNQGFEWKKVEGLYAYWKKVDGEWVYASVVCPMYFGLVDKEGKVALYGVVSSNSGKNPKTLSDFEAIKVSVPTDGGFHNGPMSGSNSKLIENDGSTVSIKGKKVKVKKVKNVYGDFSILKQTPESYLKDQGFTWKKVDGIYAYWKKVDGNWKYARLVCPKYFAIKGKGTKVYTLSTSAK